MGILSSLQVYGHEKWQVSNISSFSEEELKTIKNCLVVASQFGNSLCLMLKGGLMSYLPVSRDQESVVGQEVKPEDVKVITLSCKGEKSIFKAAWS